ASSTAGSTGSLSAWPACAGTSRPASNSNSGIRLRPGLPTRGRAVILSWRDSRHRVACVSLAGGRRRGRPPSRPGVRGAGSGGITPGASPVAAEQLGEVYTAAARELFGLGATGEAVGEVDGLRA